MVDEGFAHGSFPFLRETSQQLFQLAQARGIAFLEPHLDLGFEVRERIAADVIGDQGDAFAFGEGIDPRRSRRGRIHISVFIAKEARAVEQHLRAPSGIRHPP